MNDEKRLKININKAKKQTNKEVDQAIKKLNLSFEYYAMSCENDNMFEF